MTVTLHPFPNILIGDPCFILSMIYWDWFEKIVLNLFLYLIFSFQISGRCLLTWSSSSPSPLFLSSSSSLLWFASINSKRLTFGSKYIVISGGICWFQKSQYSHILVAFFQSSLCHKRSGNLDVLENFWFVRNIKRSAENVKWDEITFELKAFQVKSYLARNEF